MTRISLGTSISSRDDAPEYEPAAVERGRERIEEKTMKSSLKCIVSVIATCILFSPLHASADAITDWNTIMINTVAAQNPFAQARYAAITHWLSSKQSTPVRGI